MTRSSSDRQRTLKWVLLVTVARTVLDDATRLRTASVRQDQRKYCVLLVRQLANGLRPSCAQASCKECASQSAGSKGSPLKCEPATTLRVYCFAVSRLER